MKIIPQEIIQSKIFFIRGKKVILDKDLAELYGVKTEQLTRQVRRNMDRFPEDFLLQLSDEEFKNLIRHFGRSSWGGTRKLPFAFTEHGILMLSSVLNSKRAVQVNIQIMRTFTRLREMLAGHVELRRKIEEMPACRQAGKINTTTNPKLSSMPSRKFWNRRKSPKIRSAFT